MPSSKKKKKTPSIKIVEEKVIEKSKSSDVEICDFGGHFPRR